MYKLSKTVRYESLLPIVCFNVIDINVKTWLSCNTFHLQRRCTYILDITQRMKMQWRYKNTRYTIQPSIHILTGGQLGSAGGMLPWKGTWWGVRFEHPGLGVPDEHDDEGEVGTACKLHKTYKRHMGNVTQGYTAGYLMTELTLAQNKQVVWTIINKAEHKLFKSFSQQEFTTKRGWGLVFLLINWIRSGTTFQTRAPRGRVWESTETPWRDEPAVEGNWYIR